jgi:thiamine-monophosphate kinase
MKLTDIGEFGLIKAISQIAEKGEGVVMGVGDDAAVLRPSPGMVLLVTADLLLEGVHFTLAFSDPYWLGRKAVSVNLSDIAACGGRPKAFLVSLAVPPETTVAAVQALYKGMMEQASMYGCSLIGGDTSRGTEWMISLTLIGEAEEEKVVYRRWARQGDWVFVTGTLGDAALGLKQLKNGIKEGYLVERHRNPTARVKEGAEIARQGLASAMIDISDGLIADLGHILEQSGVGAQVHLPQLPLSVQFREQVKRYYDNPYLLALAGGEDYELLFTVPPERVEAIKRLAQELGTPMTMIGEITGAADGVMLIGADGRKVHVEQKGHDHFKS